MKVLVTGYDGYIGTVLVEKLLARGYEVRGLDAGYLRGCSLRQNGGLTEAIEKDIRDVESEDLSGVEAIVHLAALSNDAMGELDARLTLEVNFEASLRLARLAKAMGIRRFVFASSCSMYGASSEASASEDAPLNPLTAYALSKVKAEEALSQLADDSFSPTFLRGATVYGFSPKLRFDLVLNNLMGWAITTGQIRIMSDGTPWRPLVHVEDIADAYVAALEAPIEAVHGQAFNIGQDIENYQVRDIAETVRRVVPGCRVVYAGTADSDARSYRVDFSKVRRALPSFQPRWNIERGAQQLCDALTANGVTREDFESRCFFRVKQLQYLLSTGMVDANLRWSHTAEPREVNLGARQ
jgi:nucleoside-diphosphate-sugar epimerase